MNFYFNLLNLLNRFDGVLGNIMRKATHPSGGVGSSNPHRLRGWGLHHHGMVFIRSLCCVFWSRLVVVTRHM
jgi:hypothetical protein